MYAMKDEDYSYTQDATCRTVHPELFFPPIFDDDLSAGDEEIAKAVCAVCPVIEECRVDQRLERFGIRFGTSPIERGFRSTGNKGRPGNTHTKESIHGLQDACLNLLRDNPDQIWTKDTAAEVLMKWPESSVRAALTRLYKRGYATRDIQRANNSSRTQVSYFQWVPQDDEEV